MNGRKAGPNRLEDEMPRSVLGPIRIRVEPIVHITDVTTMISNYLPIAVIGI